MPKQYLFHKRHVLPRMYQFERHLTKLSPKGSALFSKIPTRSEIAATMQGEGLRRFPPDPGMHTLGNGIHRKKLHPLKFKC